MRRVKPLDVLAVLATPLLTVAALVGLGVGIALKLDVPTAAIVVCSILLIDIAIEDIKGKGGAE